MNKKKRRVMQKHRKNRLRLKAKQRALRKPSAKSEKPAKAAK